MQSYERKILFWGLPILIVIIVAIILIINIEKNDNIHLKNNDQILNKKELKTDDSISIKKQQPLKEDTIKEENSTLPEIEKTKPGK